MSDWLASLRALLPPGRVSSDLKELRRHASDAWSVAIKVRQQDRDTYQPQAVAYPHDQDEVARLLEWAHERRIAITPWGAGSSVTGAPLPLTGGVTVDLSRMDAPASIDRVNLLVTAQAGVRGDRLERALNDAGLTLGHSPQSLDRSTVGGWVATRATGQFSSRYGGIEDLVVALTAVLPTGEVVQTQPAVRPPFGPDVNALFIGAEGTWASSPRSRCGWCLCLRRGCWRRYDSHPSMRVWTPCAASCRRPSGRSCCASTTRTSRATCCTMPPFAAV